jgi:broad specificity phosphatase PhoE
MPPKQLHLVRHAQGYHNLSLESHKIRDPLLTPYGEQQCHNLASTVPDILTIDYIIASPMRRTLYTALITFKVLLEAKPNLKIIALPELQETSMMPCDVGSSVDELRLEFAGKQVDLSHVHDGWNDKLKGPFSPETNRITSRCRKARRFLQQREDESVAVISHGGLLHFFTEDWQDSTSGCGKAYL